MATHSSVLAWRIPGTGEAGGLPSMGFAQIYTQKKSHSTGKIKQKGNQLFHLFREAASQSSE